MKSDEMRSTLPSVAIVLKRVGFTRHEAILVSLVALRESAAVASVTPRREWVAVQPDAAQLRFARAIVPMYAAHLNPVRTHHRIRAHEL